jgi:hypothetical protein
MYKTDKSKEDTMLRNRCLTFAAALLALSLAACEKKDGEGPAERAGKQVDKAVEQAGKTMDKAAESAKEGAKQLVDKTKDAAK